MHAHQRLFCLLGTLAVIGSASGNGDIHTSGSFVSDAPGGTPPLVVNSSDLVSNLNADMLDGAHGTDFALKTELPDDGVLEINQDCAVNTGCFAGDDPGFPVTINPLEEPATSFRLTSNLDVSAETTPEDAETAFLHANTSYRNGAVGINMNLNAVVQEDAMWTNGGGDLNGGNQIGSNWCSAMLCP